jgi:endonuclease-3 related protein
MELSQLYERLLAEYGRQDWWPGETPLEVLVGAVLVQNTAWKNVEKAIANLKDAGLLDIAALHGMQAEELAELIRSAGYYRVKAQRLKRLIGFIHEQYDGSLDALFADDLETARMGLLSVNGVGPETADSILLYAGHRPTFVVDTYTKRILARHGWIDFEADYHELKEHMEAGLPREVELYNEFHALLVRVGHLHCRKTPKCDQCPLYDLLPNGKPLEPEYF